MVSESDSSKPLAAVVVAGCFAANTSFVVGWIVDHRTAGSSADLDGWFDLPGLVGLVGLVELGRRLLVATEKDSAGFARSPHDPSLVARTAAGSVDLKSTTKASEKS